MYQSWCLASEEATLRSVDTKSGVRRRCMYGWVRQGDPVSRRSRFGRAVRIDTQRLQDAVAVARLFSLGDFQLDFQRAIGCHCVDDMLYRRSFIKASVVVGWAVRPVSCSADASSASIRATSRGLRRDPGILRQRDRPYRGQARGPGRQEGGRRQLADQLALLNLLVGVGNWLPIGGEGSWPIRASCAQPRPSWMSSMGSPSWATCCAPATDSKL